MFISGSIVGTAATDAGLLAASIAVFGFLVHAPSALSGAPDGQIRWATVVGGLAGLGLATSIIVLSAFIE
jgi:hypothetical protein